MTCDIYVVSILLRAAVLKLVPAVLLVCAKQFSGSAMNLPKKIFNTTWKKTKCEKNKFPGKLKIAQTYPRVLKMALKVY